MAIFTSELSGSLLFKKNGTLHSGFTPGDDRISVTGSMYLDSGSLFVGNRSVDGRLDTLENQIQTSESIGGLNAHTGSTDLRLDALQAETGSYLSTASYSGSNLTFTKVDGTSFDLVIGNADSASFASTASYINISNVEGSAGLVSSSKQITDFGFISQSIWTNIVNKPADIVSSSNQLSSDISGSFTSLSSSIATRFDGLTSDYTELTNIPVGIVSSSTQLASDISGSFTSTSQSIASDIAAVYSKGFITGSALDMKGNRVTFGNVYDFEGDLPSATDYHGMFAHVHATGYAYFAHNGNWVKLALSSSLAEVSSSLSLIDDSGLLSSSAQIASEISGSFTADSASLSERVTSTLVSASAVGSMLTFTKEDSSTFNVDIASGSVESSSFATTASYIFLKDIDPKNFSLFSSSQQLRDEGFLTQSAITFVTNSNLDLRELKVNDYDADVGVDFADNRLTLTFGTPAVPSSFSFFLSGFSTDRWNRESDEYTVSSTWNNGGYTFTEARIYEATSGSVLASTTTANATSLQVTLNNSGSHTYQLQYTASSPLDGSVYNTTRTTTGTINKTAPASPSISGTPDVQLGASSNQIEQGATGSITYTTSAADPSNRYELDRTTATFHPQYILSGSATGSSTITNTVTAFYDSPTGLNSPDIDDTTRTNSLSYTKIRSVRYGATGSAAFTAEDLANLALWDTTLGGSVGTIDKGNTYPSGDSITFTWTGDKYHYIVYDSSRSDLTNITTGGFGVLGQFTKTTVGSYKVYKTNTLQAGGAGTSITYVLT